jgi:nitrogen fixation NifU-like protein
MAYSDKVLDHFNAPRNIGSFPKSDSDVGTGMVGAPECGDVAIKAALADYQKKQEVSI